MVTAAELQEKLYCGAAAAAAAAAAAVQTLHYISALL